MDTYKELKAVEILHGIKTAIVCKKEDIPENGQLRITDLHGNVHIEQYSRIVPRSCFSKRNVMLLNVADKSPTLDHKYECLYVVD